MSVNFPPPGDIDFRGPAHSRRASANAPQPKRRSWFGLVRGLAFAGGVGALIWYFGGTFWLLTAMGILGGLALILAVSIWKCMEYEVYLSI